LVDRFDAQPNLRALAFNEGRKQALGIAPYVICPAPPASCLRGLYVVRCKPKVIDNVAQAYRCVLLKALGEIGGAIHALQSIIEFGSDQTFALGLSVPNSVLAG
jgi:hypothetical protein